MGASLHFGRVKGKQEAPTPCRVRDVEPGLTALISLRERPVTRALVPVVGRAEGAGSPGVGKPLTEKWQRGWGGVGGVGAACVNSPPLRALLAQVRLYSEQIGAWRGQESPAACWTLQRAQRGGALPVAPGWLAHQVSPGERQHVQYAMCVFWRAVIGIHLVLGQREGEDLSLLVPEVGGGPRWEGVHGTAPCAGGQERRDGRREVPGPGPQRVFPSCWRAHKCFLVVLAGGEAGDPQLALFPRQGQARTKPRPPGRRPAGP